LSRLIKTVVHDETLSVSKSLTVHGMTLSFMLNSSVCITGIADENNHYQQTSNAAKKMVFDRRK
jgi:hypothetical protein